MGIDEEQDAAEDVTGAAGAGAAGWDADGAGAGTAGPDTGCETGAVAAGGTYVPPLPTWNTWMTGRGSYEFVSRSFPFSTKNSNPVAGSNAMPPN
jgi:hypothetical protein